MRLALETLRRAFRQEARLLPRERSMLLVLLGIPLLYPLIVSFLYQSDQAVERPVLVVDADGSALSRRITLDLDATQELRVVKRLGSIEEGWAALRQQQAELLVYLPEDLSRQVKRGRQGKIAVWVNSANMYTYSLGYPAVQAVVGQLNAELAGRFLMGKGLAPSVVAQRTAPLLRDERFLFHPTGSYGKFFAVGILPIVLQQLVVISLSFSVGTRRERGLFDAFSPRPFAYLAGLLGAHLPFHLLGLGFAVGVIMPVFHWSAPSLLSVAVLLALFLAALLPVSIGVASLVQDRAAAFQIAMFFSAPLFIASGFTWPADQMPRYLEAIMAVFPATPALQALRVLSMKTGSLAAVAPELLWLLAQLCAFTALAWLAVHRAWSWRRRRPAARLPSIAAGAVPGETP